MLRGLDRKLVDDEPQRRVRAVLGERRVEPGDLERRQLDATDDHRQAVGTGDGVGAGDVHARQLAEEPIDAEAREQIDEREVEGLAEGLLQRDQAGEVVVEVARPIGAVLVRHVGDEVAGQRDAAIDRERVEHRLERRARRARAIEHRDLAAVTRVVEVEVTGERDDLARLVIDDDDRAAEDQLAM